MSAALELIRTVEANGGHFRVDGEYLVIAPGEAAAPVMEELRQHKSELLAELARRPAMPAGVRLVSWSPKAAPVQLSECSTVTDVELFIRSTLRQLEARLSGKDWLAGGWGLSGLLARLEACGCVVALDDPRKALQ
ncbi:MAG: hypothetical protein ACLP07_11740 [Terracidiphilus sp.]